MEDWFLISTKPKKEFDVEKLFMKGGIKIYNPRYRYENRIKPFFSGYEFIYFDYPSQYKLVKYTRGVKTVLGNNEGPIPVTCEIIQEVKAREVNGLIELNKYGEVPRVGDEIEVVEGPMKGFRGIFKKELSENERVMILISYISYQGQLIIEKRKLKKIL